MIKLYLSLLTFTSLFVLPVQAQFWSDGFETASPSSGTRTASFNGGSGGPPHTRYFKQTTLAAINAPGYTGIGLEGTQCWAAEDNDGALNGVSGGQAEEQTVTWTGINIAGRSGLSFRGLFATATTTSWDHGSSTVNADYCIVQARINGGSWTTIVNFRPSNANLSNGALRLDNNNDGLGEGTAITTSFTEFTAGISGTGTTLDLRIEVRSNTLTEEIAFDNFRLYASVTLPVNLFGFSGSNSNGNNILRWATASEQNSSYFQVERSTDGSSNFESVGTIGAAGTSSSTITYSFTDDNVTAPILFYRLKQVDLDGSYYYSNVIIIQATKGQVLLQVFPNPVTDQLYIYPNDFNIQISDIRLLSVTGIRQPVTFVKSGNSYKCNTSNLPPGMYIVSIISSNGVISRTIRK